MAIKIFTYFIYDVMSSEKYAYSSKLDIHDNYTYKKLIHLLKDKSSYYYSASDDNLGSPKQQIYELISSLIDFEPLEISNGDQYEFVRQVCALVASELVRANTKNYTIDDYNKIPKASNCKMCDFSKCKAITQVLDFVQTKCGRTGDFAYTVPMFLVDENYMTLPYILKRIDE